MKDEDDVIVEDEGAVEPGTHIDGDEFKIGLNVAALVPELEAENDALRRDNRRLKAIVIQQANEIAQYKELVDAKVVGVVAKRAPAKVQHNGRTTRRK